MKSDTGPFAITPEWVLDSGISDRACRLYAVLGRYADQEGVSWPSRRTLAERLDCSEDSIDRAKKELVEAGALEYHHRLDANGSLTTNRYTLKRAAPTRVGPRKNAEGGPRSGAAENESHLELEPLLAPDKPTRKRDPVFDALCEVTNTDPSQLTTLGRGSLNRAVKELRQADPDEIHARAAKFRRTYPNAVLTAPALAKHWATLGSQRLSVQRQVRSLEEDRAEFARLMEEQ